MSGEEAFLALLKSAGVPAAIAAALVFSCWRGMAWMATNVIQPLTARQLKFLDDLEQAFGRQAQSIDSVQHAVDSIRESLKSQEQLLQRLLDGDRTTPRG